MFSHSRDLRRLFELLNQSLRESLDVYVIGGANLTARGLIARGTMDIDVIVPPSFPPSVQKTVNAIAASERIPAGWINTMPSLDARFLSPGWKDRCLLFYEGEQLRVFLLGREEMLGLKIAAAMDRKKSDVADILAMDPTEEEWRVAREWARNYDTNPDWPAAVDKLVAEIRGKQHG